MAMETCMTAMCKCSFGAAPAMFMVLPSKRITTESEPAANIMDFMPDNFMPPSETFSACYSPENPVVISSLGTVPGQCTPMFVTPWLPGSPTVLMAGMPALGNSSVLMCELYSGVIEFVTPGEYTITVPS
jgi:hypothetical protein